MASVKAGTLSPASLWQPKSPRCCRECRPGCRWRHGNDPCLDIASCRKKIRFFHRKRGKAALPEMSPPVFPEVYPPAVPSMRLTDSAPQTIFGFRHFNKVDIVGHQTVGPNFHSALCSPFFHQGEMCQIVFIPEECGHPAVATLGYLVRDTGGYLYTSNAGQVRRLME